MTAPACTRPVLRYHGGKWRLAPWIIEHFPPHRIYCEPYGGAASVLVQKPRAYAEVYNDLDDEVVNVFRVLRDPVLAEELRCSLLLTPYARVEYERAHDRDAGPVELARRAIIRSFMGFASASLHAKNPRGMRNSSSQWGSHKSTGFRPTSHRSGTTPALDWSRYPSLIPAFVERLSAVIIEHRPALRVIAQHDRDDSLVYVDPPYPVGVRDDNRRDYNHEMTDDDHRALGAALRALRGRAVVSGYGCALYDEELFPDWRRVERQVYAHRNSARTEVLWLNFRAESEGFERIPTPAIALQRSEVLSLGLSS